MDRGPFRGERPAERRPVNVAQPQAQPEELQRATVSATEARAAAAVPTTYQTAPKETNTPKKRLPFILGGIVVFIVLTLGGWLGWHQVTSSTPPIDTSKYQAVFFTTGQVYFGKLSNVNGDYMQLTGVFYAQTNTSTSKDNTDTKTAQPANSNDIQLIPLGEASYGPENKITIAKAQVMFYENLKSDSQAAKLIQQYLQSH